MDTTIEVSPRPTGKKGQNRRTRQTGIVPGVVYGKAHAPQPVAINPVKLLDLFKQTQNRNTVVGLKVADAAPIPCLVREVQRHPLSREILHIDFYAVPKEDEIVVTVPVRTVGRAKGTLLGGRLRIIRRELKLSCRYDRIPEFVDIDVTALDVGDFVRASAIPLPEGVSLVVSNDFNVISLIGKRTDLPEEPAAAAAKPAEAKE